MSREAPYENWFSAKEALKMARLAKECSLRKELDSIYEDIEEVAELGHTELVVEDGFLGQEAGDFLKRMGFKIEYNQKDCEYIISWRNVEK